MAVHHPSVRRSASFGHCWSAERSAHRRRFFITLKCGLQTFHNKRREDTRSNLLWEYASFQQRVYRMCVISAPQSWVRSCILLECRPPAGLAQRLELRKIQLVALEINRESSVAVMPSQPAKHRLTINAVTKKNCQRLFIYINLLSNLQVSNNTYYTLTHRRPDNAYRAQSPLPQPSPAQPSSTTYRSSQSGSTSGGSTVHGAGESLQAIPDDNLYINK